MEVLGTAAGVVLCVNLPDEGQLELADRDQAALGAELVGALAAERLLLSPTRGIRRSRSFTPMAQDCG